MKKAALCDDMRGEESGLAARKRGTALDCVMKNVYDSVYVSDVLRAVIACSPRKVG